MNNPPEQYRTACQTVIAYHQRSKHSLQRYAAGPDTIDWQEQPNPFRHFSGSHRVKLALAADTLATPYRELYQPETIPPQPLDLKHIGILFELSLGLSAWKQFGTARWSLRCNPSSGNLHPTEAYAMLSSIDPVDDGVYHYNSHDHCLERRCAISVNRIADYRNLIADGAMLIGLSSIHWREAWKYGERAFRYCQHDTGHALAAIHFAAAALGWRVRLLDDWSDQQISAALGLDRNGDFRDAEREFPEAILSIQPNSSDVAIDASTLTVLVSEGNWQGRANILDNRHRYDWPIIDEVAKACAKPATAVEPHAADAWPLPLQTACETTASTIIRQRRSAQAFDGKTAMSAASFYRLLDMTLPRHEPPPWGLWPYPPHTHLVLFVHRVHGLRPGLYALLRNAAIIDDVKTAMRTEFEWNRPDDCPGHLPLYHLVTANSRNAAAILSCHQAIAGDSCFSLGMVTEFDRALAHGSWYYRRLFWECGMIGQILYLEAEAAGLRGTGIGCYYDDAVHETLGLSDSRFQSLYHFTVGHPVDDPRLAALPPYEHL